MESPRRRTIEGPATIEGAGVIAGRPTRVELRPAPPGAGLNVRRLGGSEAVRLDVEAAVVYPNVTGIEVDGEPIFVWEHLLAVLHVTGITDLEIVVDGDELPILDGSAGPIAEAVARSGVRELDATIAPLAPREPVFLTGDGKCLAALPGEELRVSFLMDYAHPLIGRQYFDWTLTGPEAGAAVLPARSFVPVDEVKALQARGYLKGGGEENAIIVYEDHYSAPPTMPVEFARHKVLDIVGDLYLAGRPIRAHILAFRTGHADNRGMLQRLLEGETDA